MNIQKIVSDAVAVYSKTSKKPIVTVYSGIEGIKAIYMDTLTLSSNETIYALLNPEDIHPDILEWLKSYYIPERIKKNIDAHVFISNPKHLPLTAEYRKHDEERKRVTTFVEDFGKPFECEIDIYGDKVAMINYDPKDELGGIIIHHPALVRTIKSFYLHYLWKM